MIEKLENLRVLVYEITKPDPESSFASLTLIRRFVDYPHEFSDKS